ncbi:hypothetical protein EVAR_54618_1 [Eumeta japonica]|uniref:Uncharacterized protein n=1 Tax=Eumeta variegata TaxID=151549 RepID=A0A4C1YNN4_EUMVA|nr:hypothetical protein EVAR_54618_1 [Eumeta japonica]
MKSRAESRLESEAKLRSKAKDNNQKLMIQGLCLKANRRKVLKNFEEANNSVSTKKDKTTFVLTKKKTIERKNIAGRLLCADAEPGAREISELWDSRKWGQHGRNGPPCRPRSTLTST